MGKELERLTELFKKLGAADPSGWASSQLEEGIPQLERYLFLRQAWRSVVPEDDHGWIAASIAAWRKQPDGPYAGVGRALHRLQQSGAAAEDLTDLVRGMQAELLFQFCYQLEDPGELEEEVADTAWGLFRVNEDGEAAEPITGLHESVLETDPTGREMRPRQLPG